MLYKVAFHASSRVRLCTDMCAQLELKKIHAMYSSELESQVYAISLGYVSFELSFYFLFKQGICAMSFDLRQ